MKFLLSLILLFPAGVVFAGITFDQPLVIVPCEPGQAVVHADLPFRVEGNQPLSITSIKTSCNCTTGEADAPQYTPNATGKIKLTFTIGERTGLQRKTITVKTSDGQEQVAFFQTTVPPILTLSPAFVFWKKNDPATPKQINIQVALDKPVQVLSATATPSGAFTVELQPIQTGKHYTLKITPRNTDTAITARIVLKTDFPPDDIERFVIVAAVK